MIKCCRRLFQYQPKRTNLVLCGQLGAGKTALLLKLKVAEFVSTVPTYSVNIEDFEYGNTPLRVFDCSSQNPLMPEWRSHTHKADGIIYVIDSTDRKRLVDAKDDLQQLLFDENVIANRIKILIFANKQDLFSAMSLQSVYETLNIPQSCRDQCCLIGSSAVTGVGIHDGFDWLLNLNNNSDWPWRNGITSSKEQDGVSMVALNRTSLLQG